MLEQRRSRWAAVVQMLYKCFVFTLLWQAVTTFLTTLDSHFFYLVVLLITLYSLWSLTIFP